MDVVFCSASGNIFIDFLYFVAELDGADALLCDKAVFDYGVHNHCVPNYKEHMAAFNYQDECPWPSTQLCVCVFNLQSYREVAVVPDLLSSLL